MLALYWIALAVGTHWPRLSLGDNNVVVLGLDKWLHVIAFTGLVMLASAAFARRRWLMVLIVLLYVPLDEFTQTFVPGRYWDTGDLIASAIGVVIGTLLYSGWRLLLHPSDSFVHHAKIVSALTLFSRCFGLARDAALAYTLGFGWVCDAFVIAFMIPNLFRRLFGEGAMAAAFIPQYAKLNEQDATVAQQFARLTLRILFGVLGITALLICVGLVALAALASDVGDDWMLIAILTTLTVWYMPLVCVLAICSAMLQVHKRFGMPAAAPVLLNVCIIIAAVTAYLFTNGRNPVLIAIVICAAVAIAGVVQVFWAKVTMIDAGIDLSKRDTDLTLVRTTARSMFKQWLPTTLALAVFQLNVLLDSVIAKLFSGSPAPGSTVNWFGWEFSPPLEHGSVAVLGFTARLYEFPLGVFGIAVATAIFPALSRVADDVTKFAELLRKGLRLTMFIGLPASVGLMLVRDHLAVAIYAEGGAVEAGDASRVAWVLLGYASAVWAYSMNQILTRAFYAKHDAATPARVAIGMVGLNIVLNLLLIWPLGAAGLAWSTAICATIQTVILLRLVRRHVIRSVDRDVTISWVKTLIATCVMALVVGLSLFAGVYLPGSRTGAILQLTLAVTVGVGAMAMAARMLRMPELRWTLSRRADT